MPCPKCASDSVEPLGGVRSRVEWCRCRECHHVWPTAEVSAFHDEAALATCRKCGRLSARTIGRSSGMRLVRCGMCGHTSARTE